MGLNGGYQGVIDKLYALYLEKGFLRNEEALALMTSENVSLVGVNRITNKLLELGVIFADDDSSGDDDDYDRSVVDYEAVFREVVEISPGQASLVEHIRNTKPPQHREWRNLIPQMRSGNEYATNRLFDMYLRVAVRIALRASKDGGIELDDAIQEGVMGLLRAIQQYDPSNHGNIGSYLPLWIQQYIDRAIANMSRIIRLPVHILETAQKITLSIAKLAEQYGREPTAEELAQATELSLNAVRELMSAMRPTVSLEHLLKSDKNFDIAEPTEPSFDERLLKQHIAEVLKSLTHREEKVLRLRFGIDDNQERTLEEVGQMFGVTRERIRQIEAKALRKLRHPSRSKKLRDF